MIMESDGFIHISTATDNLDRYQVRTNILTALNRVMPLLKGKLLDIGCGKMPYRAYILERSDVKQYTGMDIDGSLTYDRDIIPDIRWDGITMPVQDEGYDSAIATEVLEHCPDPEMVLKEIHRILRPDGIFFFTVPFLWNLHEVPHDEYRYTPFSLERHLKNSGFRDIELFPMGGWHASMAQMLGLWVRRSPMRPVSRKILSFFIRPCIQFLISKDKKLKIGFTEGQMITGIYGWAKK
jgi:SAM-dependent methyltransferase